MSLFCRSFTVLKTAYVQAMIRNPSHQREAELHIDLLCFLLALLKLRLVLAAKLLPQPRPKADGPQKRRKGKTA